MMLGLGLLTASARPLLLNPSLQAAGILLLVSGGLIAAGATKIAIWKAWCLPSLYPDFSRRARPAEKGRQTERENGAARLRDLPSGVREKLT